MLYSGRVNYVLASVLLQCGSDVKARVRRFAVCVLLMLLSSFFVGGAHAIVFSSTSQLPREITSDRFSVLIDGRPVAVAHAAENYYFLNFDLAKEKDRKSVV